MLSSFMLLVSEVRSSYKITAEYSPDFRRDLASSSPDRIWSKLTEPFARLRTIVLQRIFTAPRRWPALNAKNDLQSKSRHFALSSFINLFKTLQFISQSSSIVTIFLLWRGLVTAKWCVNNNNTSNSAFPVRSVMLCYPPESFTTTGGSLSVLWMASDARSLKGWRRHNGDDVCYELHSLSALHSREPATIDGYRLPRLNQKSAITYSFWDG